MNEDIFKTTPCRWLQHWLWLPWFFVCFPAWESFSAVKNLHEIYHLLWHIRSVEKKTTPDLLIIVFRFQIACILRLGFFCTCSGLKTDLILWLNAISWCTAHQHKTKASGWGLVQLRGWRVGPGVHFCCLHTHTKYIVAINNQPGKALPCDSACFQMAWWVSPPFLHRRVGFASTSLPTNLVCMLHICFSGVRCSLSVF